MANKPDYLNLEAGLLTGTPAIVARERRHGHRYKSRGFALEDQK